MTVNIDYETEKRLDFSCDEVIRQIVTASLDYEKCPYEAEVSVLLTDNDGIHSLNLEHRGIDRPTDVLSFPMCEYDAPSDFDRLEEDAQDCFNPETGELLLGDIVISLDKVVEQAREYGHTEKRELAFLVAHSMLHLCGYDHIEDGERLVMETRQEAILQSEGYTR